MIFSICLPILFRERLLFPCLLPVKINKITLSAHEMKID